MITRNNLRKIIGELVVLNDKRYKSAPVIIIKSISNYERRTILDNSNGKLELYPTDWIQYDILAKKTGKIHLCGSCYFSELIQLDRDLKIEKILKI